MSGGKCGKFGIWVNGARANVTNLIGTNGARANDTQPFSYTTVDCLPAMSKYSEKNKTETDNPVNIFKMNVGRRNICMKHIHSKLKQNYCRGTWDCS